MSKYDDIYDKLIQAQEDRKRNNFNAVMHGIETGLVDKLDKTYKANDPEAYKKLTFNIKSNGIKIFRNSEGKHKLDLTNMLASDEDNTFLNIISEI